MSDKPPTPEDASDKPAPPRHDSVPQRMKQPKWMATTMQDINDIGLNPFAAQLLAEAHADKPDRFKDETIILVARAHTGVPVFIILSTRQPTLDQFKDWPTTESLAAEVPPT